MVSIQPVNGTLTATVGATLTAALLAGQFITRSGPTGDFADTFDTAALIAAALNQSISGFGGAAWEVTYYNTTAHVATLTAPAGANFTLNGQSAAVPATSVATLIIAVLGSGAVTVTIFNRASAT